MADARDVGSSDIIAEQRDWLVCHDCGELQTVVPVDRTIELHCAKCGSYLDVGYGDWVDRATALTFTALVLFVLSNAFTFITLSVAGFKQEATILSGVGALLENGQWILAGLVLTTIFLFPLVELIALLYLLVPYRWAKRPLKGQKLVLRWLIKAQPWNMLDVFLLGVLVTTVKLGDKATVTLGPAMFAYFGLVASLLMAYWIINKRNLWNWLYANNCFTNDPNDELYDCEVCEAMVCPSIIEREGHCPRCNTRMHTRIPDSLQKTTALIVAAIILYIPANIYPIMRYEELATVYNDTIWSGVLELISNDLWLIAMVVLVASLVVPIVKLLILIYLTWSVHKKHQRYARQRMMLFRVTEFVGRWSMVDVYVVTLLTASVQLGFVGVVEPGPALLPFAAVVILTMLAADTFDSRLIWDQVESQATKQE